MKRTIFFAALAACAAIAVAVLVTDRFCKVETACDRAVAQVAERDRELIYLRCQVLELQAAADKARGRHNATLLTLRARNAHLEQELASRPTIIEIEVEKKTARVLDLPEDGNQWCTTLFLDAHYDKLPDPKFRAAQVNALKMFNTEPWCLELRQQTHWNVIKTDDPRAVPYFPIVTKTPCLLIQRACGEVIYKESGSALSKGPNGLRRAIHKATKRHCPDGRCPVAWPTPKPEEPVQEEPIPAVIEKTPEAPPDPPAVEKPLPPKRPSLVPTAIAGALAFLFTVAARFKNAAQ